MTKRPRAVTLPHAFIAGISVVLCIISLCVLAFGWDLKEEALQYREKGLKFQQAHDWELALENFRKALGCNPDYAEVYNDGGIVYENMGYPELAESSYLKALEINPNSLSANANLGFLYERQNKIDLAIRYWRKRSELGVKSGKRDKWLEEVNKKLIQYGQAPYTLPKRFVRRPAKEQARSPETAGLSTEGMEQRVVEAPELGITEERIEALKFAQQYAQEKQRKDKETADLLFKQGVSYYRSQDYTVAIEYFNAALKLDPSNKECKNYINKSLRMLR